MSYPEHNVWAKRSVGYAVCGTHMWFMRRSILRDVFVPESAIVANSGDNRSIRYTYHIQRHRFLQTLHLKFPDVCRRIDVVGSKNPVTRNYPRLLCIKGIEFNAPC